MKKVEVSQIVRRKMVSLKKDLAERFDDNTAAKAVSNLADAIESLGEFPE